MSDIKKDSSIKSNKKKITKSSSTKINKKANAKPVSKKNTELKKKSNNNPKTKVYTATYNEKYNYKSSIVLLLIASIVILVLVVGATFSYYLIQTSNTSLSRNVTSKTPKIGNIILSNPTTDLHLRLNALNMKKDDAASKLYATNSNEDYESIKTPRIIGQATVNGGEDTTRYSCSYNLNIGVSGTMKDYLQTGDAKLIFSGALVGEYDLVGLATPKRIEFNNLSGTNREEELYVVLEFTNKNESQNYLQGKNLRIEFTNTNLSCSQVVS